MANRTPASSPAHFRVTITGLGFDLGGPFSQLTGGGRTADVRRYRPGGSPDEEIAGGPTSREDITVSREWRRGRDMDAARRLERVVGRQRGDVTVQQLDEDYNAIGRPYVHADALLTGVKFPDVDSDGGNDVARLELTFALAGEVA